MAEELANDCVSDVNVPLRAGSESAVCAGGGVSCVLAGHTQPLPDKPRTLKSARTHNATLVLGVAKAGANIVADERLATASLVACGQLPSARRAEATADAVAKVQGCHHISGKLRKRSFVKREWRYRRVELAEGSLCTYDGHGRSTLTLRLRDVRSVEIMGTAGFCVNLLLHRYCFEADGEDERDYWLAALNAAVRCASGGVVDEGAPAAALPYLPEHLAPSRSESSSSGGSDGAPQHAGVDANLLATRSESSASRALSSRGASSASLCSTADLRGSLDGEKAPSVQEHKEKATTEGETLENDGPHHTAGADADGDEYAHVESSDDEEEDEHDRLVARILERQAQDERLWRVSLARLRQSTDSST